MSGGISVRLLLAEDEKELSNALVVILKHSNYSVDAVYNGQDALDYITNGDYDGVVQITFDTAILWATIKKITE